MGVGWGQNILCDWMRKCFINFTVNFTGLLFRAAFNINQWVQIKVQIRKSMFMRSQCNTIWGSSVFWSERLPEIYKHITCWARSIKTERTWFPCRQSESRPPKSPSLDSSSGGTDTESLQGNFRSFQKRIHYFWPKRHRHQWAGLFDFWKDYGWHTSKEKYG